MTAPLYIGKELEIFAQATNWKAYWSSQIRPHLTGDILEVGAGLGSNTEFLKSSGCSSWTCLEPDSQHAARLRNRMAGNPQLSDCRVILGTTEVFNSATRFDAIIYIDVLEHIREDREEMDRASGLLRTGGKIFVLAPAHQWLYTPFDASIGHFRRYTKITISECSPIACKLSRVVYLDSVGMLASVFNRLFLQQREPRLNQVLFWDRVLVPCSRFVDILTMHQVGKSILGIWKKS